MARTIPIYPFPANKKLTQHGEVRKGQAPGRLSREAFGEHFRESYFDPKFDAERQALARIEEIAWQNYDGGRKAPVRRKAGKAYADPNYELSMDWITARDRIEAAGRVQRNKKTRSRVLVIVASPRNDGTCPGEISKTFRLASLMCDVLKNQRTDHDLLDLSVLTSEYGKRIFPCKGCVSTAMPLCHWPCSCYPNHALNQVGDWMNEIYERWKAAHGVIIVTPVHWYQVTSPLKLMMDRLVCADGGNPDPTATGGKDAKKAKALELKGWDYPKHLADRVYGVMVHGDVAGIEGSRRALADWLDWMGLKNAGSSSVLDRYIGYYEPYATSHATLDRDQAVQEEARNIARAVARAVVQLRAGKLTRGDEGLTRPRPK